MTERSESERAELVALADWIEKSDYLVTPGIRACKQIVAALRSLAAQDQKPVAWHLKLADDLERLCCAETEGKFFDLVTDSIQTILEALRRGTPPAAGWDQAIEACKQVAEKWLESFMGGEAYVARSIVNAIEALRTPAATKSADAGGGVPDHGGADAGVGDEDDLVAQLRGRASYLRNYRGEAKSPYLMEQAANVLSKPAVDANASAEARLREALEVSGDALDEYYRYWTGGESRGSYDGRPERDNLWKAMYAVRAARKALSAHPLASDCDKQGER